MIKLIWAYYYLCYVAVAACAIMMVVMALQREWLDAILFAIAGVVNDLNLRAQHKLMFPEMKLNPYTKREYVRKHNVTAAPAHFPYKHGSLLEADLHYNRCPKCRGHSTHWEAAYCTRCRNTGMREP